MCFSRKKKVEDPGPKYDFSVPTPDIPEEPSQFVIVGPTGTGKRALASSFAHLTLPFSMDLFDPPTQLAIRFRAQYTAILRAVYAVEILLRGGGRRSLMKKQ